MFIHIVRIQLIFPELKRQSHGGLKPDLITERTALKKGKKYKQNAVQFIVQHEGVLVHCAASFLKLSHYFWRCTRVTPFLFRHKDRALNLRVHHLDMNKRLTGH